MSEILIYQAEGQPVEVRLQSESVWLTQRQMAGVFDTTPENVLMHLRNIFSDGELDEVATAKDFLAVQTEGRRQVQRRLVAESSPDQKDTLIRLIMNMLALPAANSGARA